MSSTSVSVTAGEVLTTIFESHSIKIIGKYTVLAAGDDVKLANSLSESAPDGITIINIAEGDYLDIIISGINDPKYVVISIMTSEYEAKDKAGTIPASYYFMGSTYDKKPNSKTNDIIHQRFKDKLGRETIVNSKMVIVYAILQLWYRATSYGGINDITKYQKFLYNYPVILDDDLVYVLNSNNYGGSQLSIINYNTETLYYAGTWIADALAYTNNTYTCDFTFDESILNIIIIIDLGIDSVKEENYYHIGILYDFSYDYDELTDLDYVIQIINRQDINDKKILLHYGSVKHDDVTTYVSAIKSFVELYPDTSLCFLGTTSSAQRSAISKTLIEVDKLLFVPSTVYESECNQNIIMLGPGLFQRLTFALITMLRLTNHIVLVGDNLSLKSQISLAFLQQYANRFEVPCCVNNVTTDSIWYSAIKATPYTIQQYLQGYLAQNPVLAEGAAFLVVLPPKETEDVLQSIKKVFPNRKTHIIVAFDIDEKILSESNNKEAYDEVYVPGMYFSERLNEQNLILQSFIKTFYGDVTVMLSTTAVILYETFLVIKKSIELTNSLSGTEQRMGLYNMPIDTPEGVIVVYTSNHADHHIVIGLVDYENGKYDIHITFQYNIAIMPMVYLPLITNFESCDWSTFESVGRRESNYLNIYFIGDYINKYEETGSLAILMQGVINSMNLKGGMLGKELVFSYLGCPVDFDYAAEKAVHLVNTHTVVIFSNCDAEKVDFMSRAFGPTSMMLISFGFNPGSVCKQLILSAYPSPYQVLIPSLLELISYGYDKYYIISSKTSEFNTYLPFTKNILNDFNQDIFDSYIFKNEVGISEDEIKNVVYNIFNGLKDSDGLVISFLSPTLHQKLLKRFKIFEEGTGSSLSIKFVSYSYRDTDKIDRKVDLDNYVVLNYIPYLDTPENKAFKDEVKSAFPEKEFHYIDALAHSLLTTWVSVLSKLTVVDFNAVIPLIYKTTLRTPVGLVSIDASNHIHQSIFLMKVGNSEKSDEITELSSGLQGNPYFTKINAKNRRICDWTTYYSDDYEPPVCHIGISSSFCKNDIYDTVEVVRGTIGAIEFINSHDAVNKIGCYLIPYLIDESDLEEYKKELKEFGELTYNEGRVIGGIILGGFSNNCLNDEVFEIYDEYHLIYFYIKRTVGNSCNKEIVYMSESLYNNFAFTRTFSNISSNVVLLHDPSNRSTEAYNVIYPELIRSGYSVIVRKISDTAINMNSVADFIKGKLSTAVIINLITHGGSKMIFDVFVEKGLIPPNYVIYTYFSKTEKFSYASRYKSPFYSYVWAYPCDDSSKEYDYLYTLFTSIKYNDEKAMLSFAVMQIYYTEMAYGSVKDMNNLLDAVYNKEYTTIIGSTIINSNNMLRKSISLYKFQDGKMYLSYDNNYQITNPTVYSLYEDPIYVCDWKNEVSENGTYVRESIHIAVIMNTRNDKSEMNWFTGVDVSVQYYNQENVGTAIIIDIYEYNNDYDYLLTILDTIYDNNNNNNNNKTKAIFACREEKCLNIIKDKINSNNLLLFTTAKEEGQKCNKMIISLGLLPNQYLEPMMNYIISTTGTKAMYFFGLDDNYSKTLYNLTEGIYKGIVSIKGSTFVSDSIKTIDNNLIINAVDLLSENGGYIVCSLNSIIFSNLVKVSKSYIANSNINIVSLNNDDTEIKMYMSNDIISNILVVDSYFPGIKSTYQDVIRHYTSYETVDSTFARAFESIMFFHNAYFSIINKEKEDITADDIRVQLYKTKISGFVEELSLDSNNHIVRGVYIGKYDNYGNINTLLPFNTRIIPNSYNKLYEESYNYYCDFTVQDEVLNDKVYAVLFLLSLTGVEADYYEGTVTVIEEFFAQIKESNSLSYTLTYMLEDMKSDSDICLNLINQYKNKVVAIFGTPTFACINNMKLDDGNAVFISFSRELGEYCDYHYFSATFDFAQYDSAISQLLYLDPPAVAIIAYEHEGKYIERTLKKFLVTPLFNIIADDTFSLKDLANYERVPDGGIVFFAGPASVALQLDSIYSQMPDIKVVILSAYRIPIQNLNSQFYAISPYFPEIDNNVNKDFITRIRSRLSDDSYITPEMEYLYSALQMVYKALKNVKNVEDGDAVVFGLENVEYSSPEGTISYSTNHRLKHFAYRAKSKGNKNPSFVIEDISALTPGEVYSLSNSDTSYRTCYFQNGDKIEQNQSIKSFGIVISSYKEEKILLYNGIYAVSIINQENGLLGHYINVVSKQCDENTLDKCWGYIDEMRKNEDILFIFTGFKEDAILYYNEKMEEDKAQDFLIDFPKFSQNFCTYHSYHYFVSPSELARGISLLSLQIGKEFLILYSETTESKEVASLTEGILNRYNSNLNGKITLRDLEFVMTLIRRASDGLVLLNMLNNEESVLFINAIGDLGITAKKFPIISAFVNGDDIELINPKYVPNNYIVTSFHEAIGDSANYESTDKTSTTTSTFSVPVQAKPFIDGFKGYIGQMPVTPIAEAAYTAIRSMGKLYELAYSNNTQMLRSLLMNNLYNSPSGETYISETSFLSRRIWTIRYDDNNKAKIIPNIIQTVVPEVFDGYANETLGMECTIDTEAEETDLNKYHTRIVKHETKSVLFYHELTSEDGMSETTRALIESEIVKTVNDEKSFGDFLMIPKYEFGNISHFAMMKAAKQYIYDDNVLAAFGCATPECRERIGEVYNDAHKLFYYTGYNEGDSCDAYILNFGNLPNEKVKIAITMASRNDISVYMILGRNDSSTQIRSNQTKQFIKDSSSTLVAECYFNLAENKEDIKKVSKCISQAIDDNPNSGRLGVFVFYYGQDFIELLGGMADFTFRKDSLLYLLFHYDESILSKEDVISLSGSYIIATYEPSIESMNNEVFKNTIQHYLFNDVYISEELENTYEAMQVWKTITITGKKKNDGVVPNDDFLRIVSQEIISSSPACDLSLTSSNYVTKCIYVLQIEENAEKTQIYPTSGEQDIVTPEPYLDKTIEQEKCVFGKIKKYYDSGNFVPMFCLFIFVIIVVLIILIGILLKLFDWTRVVKCSSPPFMYATLGGLLLLSVTGYLFSFSPLNHHWVCTERVWMLSLSVDIIFSIMFSKAWRIHKLFNNMQLKKVTISNSQLFRLVIFVVIIQCAYNGLWWGLDPSKYTETKTNTYSSYYEDVYIPQCSESYPFVIIQLIIIFASFIFGVRLAWKVRKASKEYNESLSLAITILVVLFLGVILVPLNYVMSGEPNTLMVLRSGGCQLVVFCVLVLQFGLKLYAIGKEAGIGSTYIDSFTSKGSFSKKQSRKSKRSQYESMRNSRLSSVRQVRPFFLSPYKFSDPRTIAVAILPYLKYTDSELNGADPSTNPNGTPVIGPRGSTANLGGMNIPAARNSNINMNEKFSTPQKPQPRSSIGVTLASATPLSQDPPPSRKSIPNLSNTTASQKSSPAQPSDAKNMTRVSLAERRPVN